MMTDESRWKSLRKEYRERGIVLALGAGVSKSCKLPDWPELLRRIGEKCLGKDGRDLVTRLEKMKYSLPAIAGILDSKRNSERSFQHVIREALYHDFPFREVADTPEKKQKLVSFVQQNNSTLRAVTCFCARKADDGEYSANSRVAAVVNFNVDTILRSYAHARFGTYLFRSIERASTPRKRERVPVYHMHGLIGFAEPDREDEKERASCVFTEQEYFDFFNRPHSVFNYTFLYLLREYSCLFIGMSMLDDNIRRLLHYSTAERRGSFPSPESQLGKPERKALRHFAIMKRTGSAKVDELTDTSLRRLGTRALWIDDYPEIPQRLEYVYEQSGESWNDVFRE